MDYDLRKKEKTFKNMQTNQFRILVHLALSTNLPTLSSKFIKTMMIGMKRDV